MKIFDKKCITDKIEYKDFLCYDYLILNIDLAPVLCYNKPHGVNKNLACKPFTPERTLKHKSGLASGRLCRLQGFALDLCYNKRRKSYCVSLCGCTALCLAQSAQLTVSQKCPCEQTFLLHGKITSRKNKNIYSDYNSAVLPLIDSNVHNKTVLLCHS